MSLTRKGGGCKRVWVRIRLELALPLRQGVGRINQGGSMSASEKMAHDLSRRNFLQAVGAGVPTVKLLLDAPSAGGEAKDSSPSYDPRKFTPIDLSHLFTSSPEDFGARLQARELSGECSEDGLMRTPGGEQTFRGIPFLLGPQRGKCWVVLSTHAVAAKTS